MMVLCGCRPAGCCSIKYSLMPLYLDSLPCRDRVPVSLG